MDKIKYEIEIKFSAVYPFDFNDELKTPCELANDMAFMICDEVATAGGSCSYEIFKHKSVFEK